MEYPRYHLGCGGTLNFAETKLVTIVTNKRAVDKYDAKAKIKQFNKDFYKCDKCKNFISVIVSPSWEQYVLMGKIRIEKWKYWELKKAYQARQQRRELLHDT
jgi:hypothetical protein